MKQPYTFHMRRMLTLITVALVVLPMIVSCVRGQANSAEFVLTLTSTSEPTSVAAEEPTLTSTAKPTQVATEEPTPTSTSEPTSVATEEPVDAIQDEQQSADDSSLQFVTQPFPIASGAESRNNFVWGDYNLDGDIDVIAAHYDAVELWLNQAGTLTRSSWQGVEVVAANQRDLVGGDVDIYGATAGDVDGDGRLDLVVALYEALILFLNRGGELSEEPALIIPIRQPTVWDLTLGDMDGNGIFDLAHAHTEGVIIHRFDEDVSAELAAWMPGDAALVSPIDTGLSASLIESNVVDGALLREHHAIHLPVGTAAEIAYGNMNGDDWLDVAIRVDNGTVVVFTNLGKFPYFDENADPAWKFEGDLDDTAGIVWRDLNADGWPELLVSNHIFQNNDGDLALQTQLEPADWGDNPAFGVGDVDADGDLDMARDTINLNRNGEIESDASWQPTPPVGFNFAFIDLDNDNDLDLVPHSLELTQNMLLNHSQRFEQVAAWETDNETGLYETELLDFDVDGDLDLVVASGLGLELFLNENGQLAQMATTLIGGDEQFSWYRVAWGDVNGDTFPDLLLYDNYGPLLYANQDGTGDLELIWEATDDVSQAVFGDVDGDNDLDLAAAQLIDEGLWKLVLYQNEQTQFVQVAGWEALLGEVTELAWGDVNNDGALDLAAAGSESAVFINHEGLLNATPLWRNNMGEQACSVAWGDSDGDGDNDLFLASSNATQLFLNEQGRLGTNPSWVSTTRGPNCELAWLDIDGNRRLDLSAQNSQLFGRFDANSTRHLLTDSTASIGDVNGDGLPDRIVREPLPDFLGERLSVHLQRRPTNVMYPSELTTLSIASNIAPLPSGALGTVYSRTIPISFRLDAPGATQFASVRGYYSINGGGEWLPAVATADSDTADLGDGPYTFYWDVNASGFFGRSDNVRFRLEAIPSYKPRLKSVPGVYQQGMVAATTFPFRVQGGGIRVIDENGEGVADATVLHRSANSTAIGEPLRDGSGNILRTNSNGFLAGRTQIAQGDRLIAIAPIFHTPKASLYASSAAPNATGIDDLEVGADGVQVLTVSADNPLLLFNLDVSLEWDASANQPYLTQLEADIERTSQLLFDIFNGQVALGNVNIYQAKDRWESADIQIYASSSYRPNANLGGIVTVPMSDTLATGEVVPNIYRAGQIRMAATWNRFGNASGTLGEDWPRTLAHEFAHYAFFLQDNYLGVVDNLLTTIDCQGSAMTDPFRGDYSELLGTHDGHTHGWTGDCLNSLTALTTGRNDWETVRHFYPFLKENATLTADGPTRLPYSFTTINTFVPSNADASVLPAPLFYLEDENGESLFINAGEGEAYLLKTEPDELIHLSDPASRIILARGAAVGDTVCVYHLRTAMPRVGCELISAETATIQLQPAPDWQPKIDLAMRDQQTIEIRVSGVDSAELNAQIYPAIRNQARVAPQMALTPVAGETNVFTGTISLATWANYGTVRVWEDGAAHSRQRIEQFALRAFDGVSPPLISDTGGAVSNDEAIPPPLISDTGGAVNRVEGVNPPLISDTGGATSLEDGVSPPLISDTGGAVVRNEGVPPPLISDTGGAVDISTGAQPPLISDTGGATDLLRSMNVPLNSADNQLVVYNLNNLLGRVNGITLQSVSTSVALPPWFKSIGKIYRVGKAPELTDTFAIQFQYLGRELADIDESLLKIYYLDESNPAATWQPLDTQIDVNRNRAATQLDEAGLYALIAAVSLPELAQGWNLIGYPLAQSQPISIALQSLADEVSLVAHFDATAARWLHYAPEIVPEFQTQINTLTAFEFGKGYWVFAKDEATLFLQPDGTESTETNEVIAGDDDIDNLQPPAIVYGWLEDSAETIALGTIIRAYAGISECATTEVQQFGDRLGYILHIEASQCRLAPGDLLVLQMDNRNASQIIEWNNQAIRFQTLSP